MEPRMETRMLKYDVIGMVCPNGLTTKDCELRKALAEMEEKYKIGYRVLDNGNLLVPQFWAAGNDPKDINFNLKKTKEEVCNKCRANALKKEREDRDKGIEPSPINIQTVLFAYMLCGSNCPRIMNVNNCFLRNHLAKAEEENYIGYKVLSDGTLLIPNQFYSPKTNNFRNISQESSDICFECFVRAVKEKIKGA